MVQLHSSSSISAFDCEIVREAFRKSIVEENVPEDHWREHARILLQTFTGARAVDSALLDWIVRK